MGLDMYAYTTNESIGEVDFEDPKDSCEIEYWRKNNALHGWMKRRYIEKGGVDIDFNCVNLSLSKEDLDNLICDILDNKLSPTPGFFFGNQEYDKTQRSLDLGFCCFALKEINKGKRVYYNAYW